MLKVEQTKIVSVNCPFCQSLKSDLLKSHEEHYYNEENDVSGSIEHKILKCRGCENTFIQKETFFEGDLEIEQWPAATKRNKPDWLREMDPQKTSELQSLINEIYTAQENGQFRLAAIGIRTAFDVACSLMRIKSSLSFKKKLAELQRKGKISDNEKKVLGTMIDAGSAAAHRGWAPNRKDLNTLLDALESFLHRSFVQPKQISMVKVPRRRR